MDSIPIAGESVTAATSLAGLILVYLGSLASSFGGFQPQEKKSVKARYRKRAWIAFAGLMIALAAAALGVIGKWLPNETVADVSTVVLLIAFGWGVWIALLTIEEVN